MYSKFRVVEEHFALMKKRDESPYRLMLAETELEINDEDGLSPFQNKKTRKYTFSEK